jgi:hypothetical protein
MDQFQGSHNSPTPSYCVKQLLDSSDDEYDDFIHEAAMLRWVTDHNRNKTCPSNFVVGYGLVIGQTDPRKLRLVMEWLPPCNTTSYYRHWRSSALEQPTLTDWDHRLCWIQIWLTLLEVYGKAGFHHGDLHLNNIMIQCLPEPVCFIYRVGHILFRLRSRFRVVIIDLEYASALIRLDGQTLRLLGPSFTDLDSDEQNVCTDLLRFMTSCWATTRGLEPSAVASRRQIIVDSWTGIQLAVNDQLDLTGIVLPPWCVPSPGSEPQSHPVPGDDDTRHLYHPVLAKQMLDNANLDTLASAIIQAILSTDGYSTCLLDTKTNQQPTCLVDISATKETITTHTPTPKPSNNQQCHHKHPCTPRTSKRRYTVRDWKGAKPPLPKKRNKK